jgi:cytoskeletal protein CcmA (bactofilin family)
MASTTSVIDASAVVRGNVHGEGSLEIHGRVEGDVNVDGDIAIAESGVVRGNLTGAQLTISGTVQGDLRGSEALLIERGARVLGDLSAPRIGIAPGALVRGLVRTDGEPALGQAAPRRGSVAQPLRNAPAQVAARALPKLDVARAPLGPVPDRDEAPSEPPKREHRAEAPPPVVPALGKNARAKKKRREA